ncbi:ABC transporter permease [Halomicrococcus sp. NG-SE-24]|uniref:ABC transporter permease n=1 Tax=Halomicrococcus sp. NG-SE-24 TaxID=3436928 RepID=UPI003D977866
MSISDDESEKTLGERVSENPHPATVWLLGAAALLAVEFGAVANTVMAMPWELVVNRLPDAVQPLFAPLAAVGDALANLPTLLTRDIFDNQGWRQPGGGWEGTFLDLAPAYVWGLRVVLVYVYTLVWLGWLWKGYLTYRRHYRYADWTPRDDVIDRFRNHHWGLFGAIIVFTFLVMALFAPALGPTTIEQNIQNPYAHELKYLTETGQVETVTVGQANLYSGSDGTNNVGLMTYDDYGRFHPMGTLPTGKDLFTFIVHGARVSLFIGVTAIGLSALLAAGFALLTAYYKGLIDLAVVIVGDSIMSLPRLLLLLLLAYVLQGTWIANIYNGAAVLALIFAGTGWPFLWRAVRGPAFQVSEEEWIDAAKSFGQKPRITMQKHMAPYILGYLLVYASMSLGGIIIAVAGLSFLGLGVNPPTPEWGRAIDVGQAYVATKSWHISILPGVMIVLIVTAFNALGDGIRDAIDPKSDTGEDGGSEVAAAGGSGA